MRDKLAAAAREKMTQVTQHTKEKELQAERKKRAAMFVNMLKSKGKPSSAPLGNIHVLCCHRNHKMSIVKHVFDLLPSGFSKFGWVG